jgi:hypothetical protein
MQRENDKCFGEHRPQVPCLYVRGNRGVLVLDYSLLDLEWGEANYYRNTESFLDGVL